MPTIQPKSCHTAWNLAHLPWITCILEILLRSKEEMDASSTSLKEFSLMLFVRYDATRSPNSDYTQVTLLKKVRDTSYSALMLGAGTPPHSYFLDITLRVYIPGNSLLLQSRHKSLANDDKQSWNRYLTVGKRLALATCSSSIFFCCSSAFLCAESELA